MKSERKVTTLGLIPILCFLAMPAFAKSPSPPSQPALYDLVAKLGTDLAAVGDDLATVQNTIDGVSTELGMASGEFLHFDAGLAEAVEASVDGLARFTVTVSYDQKNPEDFVTILVSYESGSGILTIDPYPDGGGDMFAGRTTFSSTIVARSIKIFSHNEYADPEGRGSYQSEISWAFSAVGSSDTSDMVITTP